MSHQESYGHPVKRSEMCGACGVRPIRARNQRYCKECHKEAEAKRRIARKVRIVEMTDELERLRKQLEAMRSA